MKKLSAAMIFLLTLPNLTGCKADFLPPRREIDDLQLAQVVGIDTSVDIPNGFMLTVASKKLTEGGTQSIAGGSGGSEGGKGEKALVLTSEGKTVFDAVRNIQTHSSKTIFWGHTDYYLIGEEAAKEGIGKCIDFVTRDHEFRIDAKIYVVKDSTAKELIEQASKNDYFILDKLESMGRNVNLLSISEEMKVSELMKFIDIHHASARVPCINLVSRNNESNKQIQDIDSCGYSIFRDLTLVGYIGRDISRGVNLITNNVGTSVVVVKDPSGQDAALEIIRSHMKVIPLFNGDDLVGVTLKTKVISNLDEIHSQMEVGKEDSIHYMELQQSEILKAEMQKVIELVLELKSDCLEICDKISLKTPLKWHKIEKQWLQILPGLKFDVQVESRIRRTYEMKEPSGYKGKE